MQNNKFKVVVIGLGHQSLDDHIPALNSSQDAELIGVVETNKERLDSYLEKNKHIKGYNNIDDFLKYQQNIDFAIIAVPHYLHYEITKKFITKGIHVLKEKPFAISLNQAKELNEIAKNNNAKIMITMQRKFNPIYSTFLQFSDKIGRIFHIDSKYTFYTDNPHEGWRSQKELSGGGCLIDMGYHIIDLIVWYFGLPDKIFAEMTNSAKENFTYNVEDTSRIIFKYEKENRCGSIFISRVVSPKEEYLKAYGTRGNIKLERGRIERYSPGGEIQESLQREYSWPSAAQDQIEYFIKVINNEKENISSPEFHFKHLAFIEAAYKSKEEGRYINPNSLLNL